MKAMADSQVVRLSTGVSGLDAILHGGLPQGHMYLVEGDPGTGKTTLAMQFLLANAAAGGEGLYVTLSETRRELNVSAVSHGWDFEKIPVLELTSDELASGEQSQYTVFHPSEVELIATLRRMLDEVDRVNPSCVVFDSLSELRMLSGDSVRYRRQLLALKGFFAKRETTVLILDDRTSEGNDKQLQSIAHGVIRLQKLPREYGATRRNLEVLKVRGSAYREGLHDYVIRKEGFFVYPRMTAAEHHRSTVHLPLLSGVPALDRLIGGGLVQGTSNLILGPTGAGKTTIAGLYAYAAALQGERAMIFSFDELPRTLMRRCGALGIPMEELVRRGSLTVEHVNPAELSPGEFAGRIIEQVDSEEGLRVLVIDSLNGYLNSMSGEKETVLHLHELLTSLSLRGVVTLITLAQHGLVGTMHTEVNVSYLADAVLLIRYFEMTGEVRQAISVPKNRSAEHEHSIRELTFSRNRIVVGEPLSRFQGVLTGIPHIVRSPDIIEPNPGER